MQQTETKVKAASAGAGVGAAIAGVALWLLGEYVFGGDVPEPVSAAVWVLVPAVLAWAAGYLKPSGGEHRAE